MGDDRPNVYTEGDRVIYRASALGNCLNSLAFSRMGVKGAEPPAALLKAFADGNRGETEIIRRLGIMGFQVEDDASQNTVELEVFPGIIIRGHIDGIETDPDTGIRRVLECKTTSARGVAKDLKERYDFQLSIYCHALGLPGLFAIGTKDKATGDVVSVVTHTMDTPKVSLAQIKARVAKVESIAKSGISTCTEGRWGCEHFFMHEDLAPVDAYGIPIEFVPKLEDNSLDEFAALYLESAQAEAAAKDAKANARKMVVHHIGGEGEERKTDHFHVSWSGSGLAKTFNKARLEKYLLGLGPGAPKIEDFYDDAVKAKSIKVTTIGVEE